MGGGLWMVGAWGWGRTLAGWVVGGDEMGGWWVVRGDEMGGWVVGGGWWVVGGG
jgi:hypothetical protein